MTKSINKRWCVLLNALLVSAISVGVGIAQQGGGTISGSVNDSQGAAISGAAVEVKSVATNAVFSAVTNTSGFYTAPSLAVGEYEVTAQFEGFKRLVRGPFTLQVNQTARIDMVLEVGDVVETIEVVGEAPLVQSDTSTLGEVIERRRMVELPINGRGALALTLLTAGVVSNAGPLNSGFGDRGIQISSLSINGSPNSMNAQMLDGNNNILSYVGEVGVPPAVDSVEEFKVQSGTMSAEFGFTAGGTINLVTRSGTNQIHGTVYEFLRNDKLDARNTFASTKLPLKYNQFGASVGGPIIKDRTFGFFNWEEYKLRQSFPRILSVPIPEFRQGDFSQLRTNKGAFVPIFDPATTRPNPDGGGLIRDQFPNNAIPRERFDPITPQILDFWPAPNRTPSNEFTFSQNFSDSRNRQVNWSQWNFKIDHRFSDSNSMFVRYTQARHRPFANDFFNDPTVGRGSRRDDQTNRNAVISDTHTFSPTLINSLRVGVMRQVFTFVSVNANVNWPSRLGLPPVVPDDQMPQIGFGYGTIGGGAVGRRGSFNWDIQNMITKIAGNHTLKIGVNYRDLFGANLQGGALSGAYTFRGLTTNPQKTAGTGDELAQFLLGAVSQSSIDRILGNSWDGYALNFFLQDDWKVSQRLTLNLGFRYDYQSKPFERHNGHINFDPNCTLPNGLRGCTVYAGVDGQPRAFMDEDYNDFGPRFGFAYDLTGKSKTVFRGGYGIFYPSIFWRHFTGDLALFSRTRTTYRPATPGQAAHRFQDGFPSAPVESPGASAGPAGRLGQSVQLTESDKTTPLTQQWNASIQHQIGEWMFDMTYAGNKGNHFNNNGYDLNQVDPALRAQLGQSLFDRIPNPNAGLVPGGLGGATITRERSLMAFPHYAAVNIRNPRLGNYVSHQVQINVRKRMAQGLLVHFAFTGGKRMSDGMNVPVNFGPVEQTNERVFQNGLFDRQANKSVDPTDVSQRGVLSLLYELPFGKSGSPALRKIIGGWQINSIGVMQTGIPLIIRGASNFQANRPNSTGESAKLSNPTQERWFNTDAFVNPPDFTFGNVGRVLPDVRTPGTVNFDLSLLKDTFIGERVNVQFRVEAFNFLNHVNLGGRTNGPNTAFRAGPDGKNSSANFGRVLSARDARIVQFGLKIIF